MGLSMVWNTGLLLDMPKLMAPQEHMLCFAGPGNYFSTLKFFVVQPLVVLIESKFSVFSVNLSNILFVIRFPVPKIITIIVVAN